MGALALLFDTETTGLFRYDRRADQEGQPRLCSIAAELIDLESRETVDKMHRLCDGATFSQQDWITAQEPRGAFEYNGLTADLMLKEGVPIQTILMEFAAMEDRAHVTGYVAYECPFDLKVLRGERRRAFLDDRYNKLPYFDPKWKLSHLVPGRAGPSQARMYKALFGEDIPRRDKSKARGDLADLRRIFLHALDVLPVIEWKMHKAKEPVAATTTTPASMDAAS